MITGTLDGHAAELPDRARTTSEACSHILTAKSDCGKLTGQSGWRSLGLVSGCTGCANVEVGEGKRKRFFGSQSAGPVSRVENRVRVSCYYTYYEFRVGIPGGRGWSEARAKPRGFPRRLSPAPATAGWPLNSWNVLLLRLTDALGNLNWAEFAGFLAGDIDDPRGLTFFAGNQQPVAIH